MIQRIREKMIENQVDSLIITKEPNFIYAINESASGYLAITKDQLYIIAPRFYKYQLDDYDTRFAFTKEEYKNFLDDWKDKLNGKTVTDRENPGILEEKFDAEYDTIMSDLRKTKTDKEVEKIHEACKISSGALKKLRRELFTGINEFEAVSVIQQYYADKGVTDAFITNKGQTLVQKNCLEPHRLPKKQEINEKDLVIVDTGSRYQHYCSDITRTYCENPDEKQIQLFEDVKQIQKEQIEMIGAGVPIKKVKRRELELAKELGYSPEDHVLYFSHGIGIEAHEPPTLSHTSEGELEEGMVVTLEPGLHVPEIGGVRLEDTVQVQSSDAKVLSKSVPKEL